MTSHTYGARPPRRGNPDDARVIWIDEEAAKLDEINLDRLRAVYEPMGISLVVGVPAITPAGDVVCPGCDVAYQRDRENWRTCAITDGGWRPICRTCENTEWTEEPYARADRMRAYETDPGLRTRPGRGGGKSPSWSHQGASHKRRPTGRFSS